MNAVNRRIKLAGTLYMIGGAMWALLIMDATALGIPFDQPQSAPFYLAEALFVVIESLLLVGFFGVRWSNGVGRGLFGKIAFGLGALDAPAGGPLPLAGPRANRRESHSTRRLAPTHPRRPQTDHQPEPY